MGLNNSQYDAIMRRYNSKQLDSQHELEEHRRTAYEKIPQLSELDEKVASESLRYARLLLEKNQNETSMFRKRMNGYSFLRKQLLSENGFPEDYLDMHYSCPDCQDTGYIQGKKCHCFRQQAIDLFYTQSGIKEILEVENFRNFSYGYYPEDLLHPISGKSSREIMQETVAACLRYIDEFDLHFSNLFFYGGTGLGKTFLSHCIARELIERAHSVIYYSAFELFELFARSAFGRSEGGEAGNMRDYVFDCDLLIIDDLGTELTNAFVSSQLFLLLNEQNKKKKSMIISTNLPLGAFAETYSERVFSRISSSFQLFGLFGNDIRLQKKLQV